MDFRAWLATSLTRIFPHTRPGTTAPLELWAARGERMAFQVCGRHTALSIQPLSVAIREEGNLATKGIRVRIRRVECVPMRHHTHNVPAHCHDGRLPGFVPDLLLDGNTAVAAPSEATAFWITLDIAANARPGLRPLAIELTVGAEQNRRRVRLQVHLRIAPAVLRPRKEFRVSHWFFADAIANWYRVKPFSPAFWPICERYMRNFAEHGCDTIFVPMITPALVGIYAPTQLVHITRTGHDRYRFEWSRVERWIRLAKKSGITHFEWVHLFSQWGAACAPWIYHGRGENGKMLWPKNTPALAPVYRKFLSQFLPALKQFLDRHDLLDHSFFHLSDEQHGEKAVANYRLARGMLREIAPWMRIMDALSDIEFCREKLVDLPIPLIRNALDFKAAGFPSWCYYCMSPTGRFTNRFLDTPLANIRAQGWLFFRHGFGGFLHWGYNWWYKAETGTLIDPFTVADTGKWPRLPHGDPFVVYPAGGPLRQPIAAATDLGLEGLVGLAEQARALDPGPLDSVRWEVFHEGLQDYALLQSLGVTADDPCLKSFRAFDRFPRNPKTILALRKALLR